ncbi:glutamate-rich protein 6-like isoform X4 [Mytilus californianus]|uniref:glutamate-rich protein 6-like isoform X4 n=1 Tax=Mytilus californianus TaxID=6549 RepID=UPI002247958F|nr:glutamate-rich protein 6-like isoform X4 [Mytilus californianus]
MDPPAEPVVTGNAPNSRPNSSRAGSRNSVKFPTSNPLPPIGAKGDHQPKEESDSETDSILSDDEIGKGDDDTRSTKSNISRVSSASLDKPGTGSARPSIVRGFKREISVDRDSDDERSSRRSVTFSGDKSMASKQTMEKVTYDGRKITFITLNTQTDWEWYQDHGEEAKILTGRTSKPEEEDVIKPSPPPPEDYGIPQLDLSDSDSDSSSDEDSYRRHEEEDYNYMPSIGPPNILQYNRESEKKEFDVEDPDARLADDEVDDDFPKDDRGLQYGIFGGVCEFCGHDIQPFPTLEQQLNYPPDQLFCCDRYREFFDFATTTAFSMAEEQKKKSKMINIKAHGPFSDKKAKKAAQERAEKRMKDREMARRQQEVSGMTTQSNFMNSRAAPSVARIGGPGIAPQPIVARQVKTIKYQLSSQMCLNEGWTIRPPSPVLPDDDNDVFTPEPLDPAMIADGKWRERPMIEKFYDDEQKFVTLFPDGTGNVFYPSGNLAILVSSVKLGQYHYVLHDDQPMPKTLSTFDPAGYGSCYHTNGTVRLYLDQFGGVELDDTGAKKKKWSWKDQETHVHAPPFQPICFALNKNMAVRVMGQENIAVTFSAKQRSCRFNVGTKLKLVAPENIPPKEIDDNAIFLSEKKIKVETLLDKVATLLKFPNSPKIDKILPPLHLTSKSLKTERMKKERADQITAQQNKKPGKPILVVS